MIDHDNHDNSEVRDVLLFSGGLALLVLGAGLVMTYPAIRKTVRAGLGAILPDLQEPLKMGVNGVWPDVERYLRIRAM
jgi:hypothetical protein